MTITAALPTLGIRSQQRENKRSNGRHPPVEMGVNPSSWLLKKFYRAACPDSWYSASVLTAQILDLSARPATMLSTAVMAVSMEWSWLL